MVTHVGERYIVKRVAEAGYFGHHEPTQNCQNEKYNTKIT